MWAALIGTILGVTSNISNQLDAKIQFDEDGNLIDRTGTKDDLIIGGLINPFSALDKRAESGCWKDISGDCYADFLEENEKKRLKEKKRKEEQIALWVGLIISFIIIYLIIDMII
jgi:hypothetical protein